jgi:hypothetical protein
MLNQNIILYMMGCQSLQYLFHTYFSFINLNNTYTYIHLHTMFIRIQILVFLKQKDSSCRMQVYIVSLS